MRSDPKSTAGRPLDSERALGQVFTPPDIARRMVSRLLADRADRPVKILDPCVGPQTFPQQALDCGLLRSYDSFVAIDVDREMVTKTQAWARSNAVALDCRCCDYLQTPTGGRYDFAILNPPYIRQEWIDQKHQYLSLFRDRYDINIPGTSNLYIYFVVKAVRELKSGGQIACIVYDSWQSTNFGRWFIDFLNSECHSLHFEAVSEQPFLNRLIDATIIYGTKRLVPLAIHARPAGASKPSPLSDVKAFRTVQSLFSTKRGLRLKQADFFLCDAELGSCVGATPFLKKVAKFKGYCVPDDHPEAALLVTEEQDNPAVMNELQRRIEVAIQRPHENISILTWLRERPELWMTHREPPYAPIVFNYYIRKRPRHISNPSRAYSDNFYGLTLPSGVSSLAWLAALNSTATCIEILARARNQGNGLAKIQLFEYRDVHIPDLTECAKEEIIRLHAFGVELVEKPHLAASTIRSIDLLIADIFCDERLAPPQLYNTLSSIDLAARRPKEVGLCPG